MSFQLIPMGAPRECQGRRATFQDTFRLFCNEDSWIFIAKCKIGFRSLRWKFTQSLGKASLAALLSSFLRPMRVRARLLSSGAEVVATVKFAVQFHEIPTCKTNTNKEEEEVQ